MATQKIAPGNMIWFILHLNLIPLFYTKPNIYNIQCYTLGAYSYIPFAL